MADEAAITAELMRTPLAGFTAARTAKVRELRRQGDRESADRIAALRKPSVVLWAVNQAGSVARDEIRAVRAAGERVRQAQERLLRGDRAAAAEMERATQEHRRGLDTLTRRLGMVLTAAGHAAPDDTLRRVAEVLRAAAVSDSGAWAALEAGTLTSEPEAEAFPILDVGALRRVRDDAADQEAGAHQKRVDAAQAELRRAEGVERAAVEQEEAARQRREEASRAVAEARESLERLLRR